MRCPATAFQVETGRTRSFALNEQCVVISADFLKQATDYTHGTPSP
jgi:hypothetical protein